MATKEDWLFRPVLRGVLRAESLIDGSVDLEFIATLNQALDVQDENERRIAEAAK
ncbi:hypothetical protein [Phenylobacterium sp.]|uniref:DUF6889 family protein n=1 Tax=Phenylobacterium sp. TaxID=1871053 RepID=UPI0035ADF1FD